jgi:hypothetical protein
MANATLIAPPERLAPSRELDARPTSAPSAGRSYACPAWGARVYFELDDERLDNPVMNRVCPVCGHGLPGKNPR